MQKLFGSPWRSRWSVHIWRNMCSSAFCCEPWMWKAALHLENPKTCPHHLGTTLFCQIDELTGIIFSTSSCFVLCFRWYFFTNRCPPILSKELLSLGPVAILENLLPLPPLEIILFGIVDHLLILSIKHLHCLLNFMAEGILEPLPDNLKAIFITECLEMLDHGKDQLQKGMPLRGLRC